MNEIRLRETRHPGRPHQARFDSLIGLDAEKAALVEEPSLFYWIRLGSRHGKSAIIRNGLPLLDRLRERIPLILLEGDVGCGKTELATTVASPLGEELDDTVWCLEAPTDVRGYGHVGELSARITGVFNQARRKVRERGFAILVIDEADDLATSRAQLQAHHEDRAGLNVLVKQLDDVARESERLAVILISNRAGVFDPAVVRRVALRLSFARPSADVRRVLFASMLEGTNATRRDIERLVEISGESAPPFSASDLVQRIGGEALRRALRQGKPLSAALIEAMLHEVKASP